MTRIKKKARLYCNKVLCRAGNVIKWREKRPLRLARFYNLTTPHKVSSPSIRHSPPPTQPTILKAPPVMSEVSIKPTLFMNESSECSDQTGMIIYCNVHNVTFSSWRCIFYRQVPVWGRIEEYCVGHVINPSVYEQWRSVRVNDRHVRAMDGTVHQWHHGWFVLSGQTTPRAEITISKL